MDSTQLVSLFLIDFDTAFEFSLGELRPFPPSSLKKSLRNELNYKTIKLELDLHLICISFAYEWLNRESTALLFLPRPGLFFFMCF